MQKGGVDEKEKERESLQEHLKKKKTENEDERLHRCLELVARTGDDNTFPLSQRSTAAAPGRRLTHGRHAVGFDDSVKWFGETRRAATGSIWLFDDLRIGSG